MRPSDSRSWSSTDGLSVRFRPLEGGKGGGAGCVRSEGRTKDRKRDAALGMGERTEERGAFAKEDERAGEGAECCV